MGFRARANLRSDSIVMLRYTEIPYSMIVMNATDIQRIREKCSMSQSEFAEFLGISKRTLQDWEQGRHEPRASAVALLKLADSGAIKKPKR